jgi:two-component system, NarL family, sensor kinase
MDAEESKVYLKVLIFSLLLTIIIIGFVVSFYKQQKKFNREKVKAEIRTSEAERRKLSSDLHDDLGPIMATIKIYVNAITQHTDQDRHLIGNINKYLDNGITMIREMANMLMPKTLERNGLRKALEGYVFNIENYVPFSIHFLFTETELGFNKEAELNLYRIIQEIITNTIKYSQATILQLNFEVEDNNLMIYTSDNGKGFDYKEHNFVSTGYGLSNIKSRVEILNGKYFLYSRPGEGVRYELVIPMPGNKNADSI